ncbi:MAG: uracil-DNA glycosylase [Pseudomonadota bacterium]
MIDGPRDTSVTGASVSQPGTQPDTMSELIGWFDWYAQMGVTDCFGTAQLNLSSAPGDAQRQPVASNPPSRAESRGTIQRHQPAATSSRNVAARGLAERPARANRPAAANHASRLPAVGHARAIADACTTLDELARATAEFEGCALRNTATQCCFSDGNPNASLMLVGEAPGAEEDRQGKPFVGQSGQLLDRMMATIGHDRSTFYITNAIFWRPPGNRTPTPGEIALCQPFVEKQIELIQPKLLVFVGGIAAKALLDTTEGVTKLRGRHFCYQNIHMRNACPAFVMFHPAYLLRQPLQKRLAWRDLLTLRQTYAEIDEAGKKLNDHG